LLAGVSSFDVEERILEESYHVATLDNDAARIFAGSLDFVRRIQNGRTPASAGESI
jgi:carboxylesterase